VLPLEALAAGRAHERGLARVLGKVLQPTLQKTWR
jgi:hypothetical protein